MKKMTTLCLALALTCATEAGATTDKQPKLKGRQTAAWGVAVPGSRTQSASAMRFLNMGLGAPMAAPRAVGNDPVSSVTTPGFGWADGPDGNQWYYTQNYKLDGYFYSGSTITLYDNNNQQVGQFDIDVPDTLQVNSIEMYSALTKKMFDRDDTSIEAMVSIHAVGNAENNYKDCYITRAYHIDGSGIAYECEGSGMLFDASKGWNTYQRLILPIEKVIDGKEYVSIDFIAPPTWGKDEPYVEHTLDIPFDNINYMDGAYINCFVIEDKPYYVVAQYDTAYCTMPEDYTQDIIVTPNNHFVLKTYDRNYSLVDSVAVPIEESPKGIYRMAAFGRMSDNDLSKGYFGAEDQFSYVVTWVDYHLQSDENTYNFDLYDNQAQRLKTICENAAENQWFYLNNVKGKSEQMAFLQALEEGQQIQMVDVPSCEKRTLFPAMIDGEGITTSIDRYPSAKNDEGYQYVVNMRNAAEDEEGNVIARIGWYNPDLTLDHYAKFNLGRRGEYFTPLINNVSLNPYLFDTDNEMEYIYIAKKRRTDGTNKIDNILEIAKEDGTILRTFRGDDDKSFRTASVVNMSDAKNELLVAYYDNNTQDYDLNFYELPFVKFAKGGNGSKENPYLISTVGDLSYMAAAPDSAYRLAADIDMNDYNYDWTPVPTFNGSFDGAHHAIVNLSITTNDAHAGLFGMLGEDVEVKDLVFARPTIQMTDDNQFVGVLAGKSTQDNISNVHVFDGQITGEADATIGGIVGGSFLYTNFNDCSFQGNINTPEASPVGGIVGRTATSTKITACASNAEITGYSSVGGIAGSFSANDTINDCHATGKLVAANTIGGIVGESSRGVIDRCVFNGSVTATEANWSGLSAGGIVGSLAADWSQQTTPVISHCVSTGTVNAEEPDETVHAIAGWTIANEYYEDGETPLEEKGLASNYSTAAPEESADSSLDGAPVKVADLNDDFFKQMGYAFGQDTKAPWKSAETTPVLYFENTALVLTLSDNAVLLDNDADCYITATVYGQSADDITAVSDNSNVADVDIESREDGVATLHITSYKDGVANINVTVGTLTMACTVTVDHTLTTVKPLDKGQKLTILVAGNTISAPGATAITAYTLDGQVAAQSASTISALAKGLYIVKATDATGRQTTAKVMVK